MKDKINLVLAIVALLAWSGALIYFYASGRIEAYLADRFQVMALIGGLGLFVVAIFNATRLFAKDSSSCGHDHHDHGDEHDHDHEDRTVFGNAVTFVLMVAPLMIAAVNSKDAYVSPQTIINKSGKTQVEWSLIEQAKAEAAAKAEAGEWEYTLDDLKKVVDTSDDGNLMLAVDQLFYTNGDAELQRVLEGQPIETIGQVIPEIGFNPDNNRLRVFRLMMTCCAADAQPISIPIEFTDIDVPDLENGDIKEMGWVKISGTMMYLDEEDRKNGVIKVKTFVETDEPLDYLQM